MEVNSEDGVTGHAGLSFTEWGAHSFPRRRTEQQCRHRVLQFNGLVSSKSAGCRADRLGGGVPCLLHSSCVSIATWELGEPRSPRQCPCQSESLKIQKQSCKCHFPTVVSVPASPSLWRSFPEPSVLRQNLETDRFGCQPSCFLALTFHWSLLLTETSLEKPGSYPPRWRQGPRGRHI